MAPLALLPGLANAFGVVWPFIKKNFVPILIVSVLLCSHWYAYDTGKDRIEAKYAEQREALLEENARLNELWIAQSQELAQRQAQDRIEVERDNAKRAEEIAQYVRDNPKDPSCDLTESDVEFLRDSVR